ncbi:hypothetical protein [uncultured Ruegeria sp.]|uniref:hypothetical protein n=1 Tax=uncultured Ruegeria sp. TaxID=259304 RepID=UPI002631671B|nr:hypothetical protein [uncultured Ruegeria sp.]
MLQLHNSSRHQCRYAANAWIVVTFQPNLIIALKIWVLARGWHFASSEVLSMGACLLSKIATFLGVFCPRLFGEGALLADPISVSATQWESMGQTWEWAVAGLRIE